jgi:hypothetical protein
MTCADAGDCCITRRPSTSRATATGYGRRRRQDSSGASPGPRPSSKRRRWEPRREPGDTRVGEQGTSCFGVFGTVHFGLDSPRRSADARDAGPRRRAAPRRAARGGRHHSPRPWAYTRRTAGAACRAVASNGAAASTRYTRSTPEARTRGATSLDHSSQARYAQTHQGSLLCVGSDMAMSSPLKNTPEAVLFHRDRTYFRLQLFSDWEYLHENGMRLGFEGPIMMLGQSLGVLRVGAERSQSADLALAEVSDERENSMSTIAGTIEALHQTSRSSFHRRIAPLIVWGTWSIMLVAALLFVRTYGSNVPSWDDWDMVPTLTGQQPITASWLWSQHNEHRVPLPRLVLLGLHRITGINFRTPMFFSVFALSVLAFAMIWIAKCLRGWISISDAFFPLVLLHWGAAPNFLWGWQLQFVSSTVLAGIVAFVSSIRIRTKKIPLPVVSYIGSAVTKTISQTIKGRIPVQQETARTGQGEHGSELWLPNHP